MLSFIKLYITTFSVFMVIDLIWLGFIAKNMYRQHLGFILSPKVNWPAAVGFYLLYILGLIFFVIRPALAADKASYALMAGAFFGLVTYATYDMTNLATVKDWPLFITVVDLAWGTTLGALTSFISFSIYKSIG